jgi:hypothetical protein
MWREFLSVNYVISDKECCIGTLLAAKSAFLLVGKPWSLSYLCRIAIRTAIGTERIKDIHYDLAKCLPPPLCSYVANETNNFSSSKA